MHLFTLKSSVNVFKKTLLRLTGRLTVGYTIVELNVGKYWSRYVKTKHFEGGWISRNDAG